MGMLRRETFTVVAFVLGDIYFGYIPILDRAVNQEMHQCKYAEEQRKQVGVKQ